MTIQYCSDLHLELPENREWLARHPLATGADVLLVAGDTGYLGPGFADNPFLDLLSAGFGQVFLLPGNHEYYRGYDAAGSGGATDELLRSNVRLVNNRVVLLDGVELVFSILWSHLDRQAGYVSRRLTDFHRIQCGGEPLTVAAYNRLHGQCRQFLREALSRPAGRPRVVVTHHLPSPACNAPEFAGSPLNEAFCTDLDEDIRAACADFWIYGHSHRNRPPIVIGGTTLLTNQLGYVRLGEQGGFDPAASVRVSVP